MRRISTPPCLLPNSRRVSRLLARTAASRSTEQTSGNQHVHSEEGGYMSVRSNTLEPDAMSAIVNCLCPECGGVIEVETNQLECLRCGKHWRQVWERIRLRTASKVKRLSPTRSLISGNGDLV